MVRSIQRGGAAAAVDDRLPTPLYHQIYLILRDKIAGGAYRGGDLLPSEEETARQFGVSRITAKRALNELADAGYVVRERGRGTRVVDDRPAPPVRANVEGLLENLMAMGLKTKVTLLEFAYVAPGEAVAQALQCASTEKVQRAVRVRHLEGEPFSYLTTYVPEDVGRSFGRDELASTPLLTLLERSGVEVCRAEQTLTATLADAAVASRLDVDLGAPLLRIARIVYDQQDRPVEFIIGLYRPDRYQYRMALSRVQTDRANAWSPTG
jgi:GntR family transcriptional regulator